MQIGYSPSTGQYFGRKSDGSIVPLRIGTSQSTGKRYYQDEDGSAQLLPDFGQKESIAEAAPKPQTQEAAPVAQPQAEAPADPAPAQAEAPRPQPPIQLELENPVEGEDYEAPTAQEQAIVDKGADAIRSVLPSGETMRGLGLGTRNVLQGITGLQQPLLNAPLNAAIEAFGGPQNYFDKTAGQAVSDYLGLPTPQTKGERILSAAEEMAAGAVPFLGAGNALAKATSPVAQNVGKFMAAAPVEQVLGSAAAGAAEEAVKENGGNGAAQLIAAIGAGMTPSLGVSALRTGSRAIGTAGRALDLFSEAGRDRAAGRTLARAAGGDANDLIRAAENEATEIVPGSRPTLGQVYPGENLATLEKGVASSGQGQRIQDRYMEQEAARQAAIDNAVGKASGRLAAERQAAADALPSGVEAEQAGAAIRDVYDQNYRAARQATNKAYEAIDPEGAARFDLAPLFEANAKFLGNSRYGQLMVPSELRTIQGQLAEDVANGVPASFEDIQSMRTMVSDLAYSAKVRGDKITEHMAEGMKQNIEDFLEKSAQSNPGMAKRYQEAKQSRVAQSDAFEKGANQRMPLAGPSLTGKAVSDPAVAGQYFSRGDKGGENMRAFLRMANGSKEAMSALKDYARGLLHASAFGKDGALSASRIAKFRKDYGAALKEMPDLEKEIADLEGFVRRQERQTAGIRSVARQDGDSWKLQRNVDLQGDAGGRFGPQGTGSFALDELKALASVQRDAQRAQRATQLAQVKGSPTAQLLATQDLARRFWGENAGPASSWLGSAFGNMVQGMANKLYGGTNIALNERLVNAMVDPAYAAYLLKLSGVANQVPRESLLDMLARSGAGALNVSARTAAEVKANN